VICGRILNTRAWARKMTIAERYVRYLLKCECKRCGDAIFHHEEDARHFVEHSMEHDDSYSNFELEMAQAMLSWRPGGKYCDYCDHMLG